MFAKIKEKCNVEFFFVCFKIGLAVLIYRGSMELIGIALGFVVTPAMDLLGAGLLEESVASDLTALVTYGYQILVSVLAFGLGAFSLGLMMSFSKKDTNRPIYAKLGNPFLAVFFIFKK